MYWGAFRITNVRPGCFCSGYSLAQQGQKVTERRQVNGVLLFGVCSPSLLWDPMCAFLPVLKMNRVSRFQNNVMVGLKSFQMQLIVLGIGNKGSEVDGISPKSHFSGNLIGNRF